MKRYLLMFGLVSGALLAACGGGDSSPVPDPAGDTCNITVSDSQPGLTADGRIHSHTNCSTYQAIANVRKDGAGNDISIDYMVHNPTGSARALLVLIAGGDGDAKIEGDNGVGQPATRSSGNFLVRSAHLFAAQGYKVVTIDRPSDFTATPSYDDYRTSSRHAVDISTIINKENTANLPVVIAGTSRGAISAVAQSKLADAITLSSPVTTGGGTPVSEGSGIPHLRPSSVTAIPVHVMWHLNDECTLYSPPAGSQSLADAFNPSAAISTPNGGFNATDYGICNGNGFHGFYGMETRAVNATALWINSRTFPTSKPVVNSGSLTYATATEAGGENISGFASASVGGGLTFSLPIGTTSLGGTVTLNGTNVYYIPPGGVNSTTDSFVYVVSEAGGGKSHNVFTIAIP